MARPTVDESILPTHAILKAAEDIHDIAWSLQANPFDPNGCEQIALQRRQALRDEPVAGGAVASRCQCCRATLDAVAAKLEAILESVLHELKVDDGM